jgi:hypothetical protein
MKGDVHPNVREHANDLNGPEENILIEIIRTDRHNSFRLRYFLEIDFMKVFMELPISGARFHFNDAFYCHRGIGHPFKIIISEVTKLSKHKLLKLSSRHL